MPFHGSTLCYLHTTYDSGKRVLDENVGLFFILAWKNASRPSFPCASIDSCVVIEPCDIIDFCAIIHFHRMVVGKRSWEFNDISYLDLYQNLSDIPENVAYWSFALNFTRYLPTVRFLTQSNFMEISKYIFFLIITPWDASRPTLSREITCSRTIIDPESVIVFRLGLWSFIRFIISRITYIIRIVHLHSKEARPV